MTRSRILGIVALAALPLLLISCSTSSAPVSTSSGTNTSQGTTPFSQQAPIRPLVPITVGYSSQGADYVYLFLAMNEGIFAREGLTVKPMLIQSAPGISALIAGQTQFTLIGGGDTLSALAGGASNLKWIGTADTSAAYLFYSAKNITKSSQLNGASIASTSAAGASTVCSKIVMAHFGITNYRIDYLGSVTSDVAAVLAGSAQGVCSNPPGSLALQSSGMHLLYNLTTANIKMAQSGIATTSEEIANHSNIVQRFLTALTEAQKVMHEKTTAAIATDQKVLVQVTAGSVTAAQAGATMTFEQQVQDGNLTPTVSDLTLPQKYEASSSPAVAKVDLKTFIDSTFAKAAATAVYGKNPPPA